MWGHIYLTTLICFVLHFRNNKTSNYLEALSHQHIWADVGMGRRPEKLSDDRQEQEEPLS